MKNSSKWALKDVQMDHLNIILSQKFFSFVENKIPTDNFTQKTTKKNYLVLN